MAERNPYLSSQLSFLLRKEKCDYCEIENISILSYRTHHTLCMLLVYDGARVHTGFKNRGDQEDAAMTVQDPHNNISYRGRDMCSN